MKKLEDYVGQKLTPAIKAELEKRGVRVFTPGTLGTTDVVFGRQNAEIRKNIIVRIYQG